MVTGPLLWLAVPPLEPPVAGPQAASTAPSATPPAPAPSARRRLIPCLTCVPHICTAMRPSLRRPPADLCRPLPATTSLPPRAEKVVDVVYWRAPSQRHREGATGRARGTDQAMG